MTTDELETLRAKLERGSHGGKQMAKLSSAEARWLSGVIGYVNQGYPEWLKRILKRPA